MINGKNLETMNKTIKINKPTPVHRNILYDFYYLIFWVVPINIFTTHFFYNIFIFN